MNSPDNFEKQLGTQRSRIDATPETTAGVDVIFAEGRELRVVVCDRSLLIRFGLYAMLEPIARVVGDAADGQSALDTINRLNPDIVIMDTDLDVVSGVDLCERIGHKTNLIVFAGSYDICRHYPRLSNGGARVFCLKSSGPDILWEAVKHVAMDAPYCDPAIAKHLPAGPDVRITTGPQINIAEKIPGESDFNVRMDRQSLDSDQSDDPEGGSLHGSAEQAEVERHIEEAIRRWQRRRLSQVAAG